MINVNLSVSFMDHRMTMIDSELLGPLTTITNILSRRPGPINLSGLRRVSETHDFTTFVEKTKEGFIRVSVTGAVFVVDIDLDDKESVIDATVSAAGEIVDDCDLVNGFGNYTIASVILKNLKKSTLREYSENIRALQVWDALGENYPLRLAQLYKDIKLKLSNSITDIEGNSDGRIGICGKFNNGKSVIRINPNNIEFWPCIWVPEEVSKLINGHEKLICNSNDKSMKEIFEKAVQFRGVLCDTKRVCIISSKFVPIEMVDYQKVEDIVKILELLQSWQNVSNMVQSANLDEEPTVVDIDLTTIELSDVFSEVPETKKEIEVLVTVAVDGSAIIKC